MTLLGHVEMIGKTVDGENALRTEQKRAPKRELPNGPATPHGDRIPRLNIAVFCGHIAGRKNV
jgi:hypothetical protein